MAPHASQRVTRAPSSYGEVASRRSWRRRAWKEHEEKAWAAIFRVTRPVYVRKTRADLMLR
eukprot:6870851-Prymnesium_polylepis.1